MKHIKRFFKGLMLIAMLPLFFVVILSPMLLAGYFHNLLFLAPYAIAFIVVVYMAGAEADKDNF